MLFWNYWFDNEVSSFSDMRTHNEAFRVDMTSTGDTLNINLENFTKDLQKEIVDQLGLFLSADTDLDKIKNVSFCSVSEEVYRQKLYMPFRKLGYSCVFTRYNDDRGRAIFKLEDATENNVKRSYYRTGLPNKYWWFTGDSTRISRLTGAQVHVLIYFQKQTYSDSAKLNAWSERDNAMTDDIAWVTFPPQSYDTYMTLIIQSTSRKALEVIKRTIFRVFFVCSSIALIPCQC